MKTALAGILAAAALVVIAPAAAATYTVSVKSSGFSPASLTIQHGDKVTFKNADTKDHQVVATDGSFASPILHKGQSWTFTFTRAGTFRYRDALYPRHTGKLTVKGPPPSVTLALSAPIVNSGTQVTLSGAVSTGKANESVELDAQEYGQPSPVQLAIVKTGTSGAFSYPVTPSQYTTYVARWNGVASGSVVAQVAPVVRLVAGGNGYMKATVSSSRSFWHKHLYLQRLSPFGQWVNIAALTLGQNSGKLFRPTSYLPRGTSRIRVFLSVNQAGNGLLSAHSGTQLVRRR